MGKYISTKTKPIETCGPNKKKLKEDLKMLAMATKEMHELADAGYISYQVHDVVFGNLYLRKRDLEDNLARIKKAK